MDRLHAFLVNGKFLLPASCITSWILCLHNTEFSIFTVCIQNSLQQIRTRFFHPVHLFEFTPGVVFPAVHGKFCTRNSFFCLCIHFFHYKISYFRQMTGNVRCVTKFRSIPRHNSYSRFPGCSMPVVVRTGSIVYKIIRPFFRCFYSAARTSYRVVSASIIENHRLGISFKGNCNPAFRIFRSCSTVRLRAASCRPDRFCSGIVDDSGICLLRQIDMFCLISQIKALLKVQI